MDCHDFQTPNKGFSYTTRLLVLLVACALMLCVTGCMSRYAAHLDGVRRDYYEYGDIAKAQNDVERRRKGAPKSEQSVLRLNAASLHIASGEFGQAKDELIAVRDEFDELEARAIQKSAEDALSYWLDDNFSSYEGEDYEKVMIRAMLAIADLFDGGADARAYAHQIASKQDEIVQRGQIDDPKHQGKKINPKAVYPRMPLGPYIEGLIWEETYVETAEAARCYEKVAQWRPQFRQAQTDLARAQSGVHSQPGNGRLYVLAFVGQGPRKEQVYAEATQLALLIADQIFSATNKYSVPPTLAPVPIPALVVEEPYVQGIAVTIDDQKEGVTETLADVNQMAITQYEAIKDQILARAIIRRIVKKGTIYAAKEVGQVNSWVSLAADVGGVVWEAIETADTRCWGLLPAKIQAFSMELPAGTHKLTIYPTDRTGNKIGEPLTCRVVVEANRNAYALASYPNREPIGHIATSSQNRE
ncbi:MAG: hypothetical protein Q4G03_02920 [Planctomycetia bacterium]|nr:hypothetical protein [Planctomycetia bacterium]